MHRRNEIAEKQLFFQITEIQNCFLKININNTRDRTIETSKAAVDLRHLKVEVAG